MPLTLIRRPRSPNVLHGIIKDEVRDAYKDLGSKIVQRLLQDIESWNGQPEFKVRVEVGNKKWYIAVSYDSTEGIGEIYRWVDEGTGEAAGHGGKYPIVPMNADVLKFEIPNNPKTVPDVGGFGVFGIVLESGIVELGEVFAGKVMHPGIRPRNFTKSLKDDLKQRDRPGGFRSVTEAAIKRGKRQIGVQ